MGTERDALDARPALHRGDRLPGFNVDPHLPCPFRRRPVGYRSDVKDCGHGQSGFGQRECRPVRIIIVRDQDCAVAGRHPVVEDIVPHGGCQHHARNIISGKTDRTFDCTGGKDNPPCPDPPHSLPDADLRAAGPGNPLKCDRVSVVVDAGSGGPVQKSHVFPLRKLIDLPFDPPGRGTA